MKKNSISLLVLQWIIIIMLTSCNQRLYYTIGDIDQRQRNKIYTQGVLRSKKILRENCREDTSPHKNFDGTVATRKQFANYDVDRMDIIPISLFEVNLFGKNYTSNISQFLQWDSEKIFGFYTFIHDEFEGLLDWGPMLHLDFSTECTYLTIHNSNNITEEPLWVGYQRLVKEGRDVSFLFGVRHFIQTLWFIENDKVYVFDLKEMKVYDPDKFIGTKCYDGFIEDIANGGQVTCNY